VACRGMLVSTFGVHATCDTPSDHGSARRDAQTMRSLLQRATPLIEPGRTLPRNAFDLRAQRAEFRMEGTSGEGGRLRL
jgi:hypothetical protein